MNLLEITTRIGCKINCAYCPQDKLVRAYAKKSDVFQMSFEVFKTCMDKVPPDVGIDFSGMCEPWLNPECTEMVLYAHGKGHAINVFTTLAGMALSDIDRLAAVPFKAFVLHLPSDQHYEQIHVDENYLQVLEKILTSGIKTSCMFMGRTLHPKVKALLDEEIFPSEPHSRARNLGMKIASRSIKKRGSIGCLRHLTYNILLPNGDVALCCMDYGLEHILGNLLTGDFDSLFRGEEFLKIKKGLRNASLNTLCRYCDEAYDQSGFAKIYNPWVFRIKNFSHHRWIRDIGDPRALKQVLKKGALRLEKARSLKDLRALARKVAGYLGRISTLK